MVLYDYNIYLIFVVLYDYNLYLILMIICVILKSQLLVFDIIAYMFPQLLNLKLLHKFI